jgi:hypothetical protein
MNQLLYINHINSSDDIHVQRCGSRPCRKPNKDRFALFHAKLLYNDFFLRDPFFMLSLFSRFIRCVRVFFFAIAQFCLWDYFELKINCIDAIGLSSLQKQQLRCACYRLVHQQRRKKNIVEWHLALLENPCCVGVGGFAGVLNINTCVIPLVRTL